LLKSQQIGTPRVAGLWKFQRWNVEYSSLKQAAKEQTLFYFTNPNQTSKILRCIELKL